MSDDSDNPDSTRSRALELSRAPSPFDASPLHDAQLTSIRALTGNRLLTTSWDGTYGIWNRHSADRLQHVPLEFEQVDLLALDPHRMLAVFGVQRGLEVRDLDSGEPLEGFDAGRVASVAPSPTHAAAFHPEGDLLFTGAQDKYLRIWDLNSGALVDSMRGHRRTISHIHTTGDTRVVSAGLDGEVRVWDLREGRCTTERWLGQYPITALTPLSRDDVFVVGNTRGDIILWDADDDSVTRRWEAHVGSIRGIATLEPPYFATVAHDGEVRVWSADDGDLIAWYDSGVDLHACMFDGDDIYVATDEGRLLQLCWPPEDL